MENLIHSLNGLVWGIPMLTLLLGTGLYLTIGLRFLSVTRLPYAFKQLFKKPDNNDEGDVTPFGALMTALSSTIGTGNIAGVAAAIAIGGPGAVFWMWMTAIVGTATKYSEGVLAVKFREIDAEGRHVGGPMYYIKNGMGSKWVWLGGLFATLGVLASWGTGASIQSNSIADALNSTYGIAPIISAVALSVGAAAVILGGIERIASVASKLVPLMAISYLAGGLLVVALNFEAVPAAFGQIFRGAFGFDSAGTGISIGLLMLAMQKGVARGIFSNEAGQGSAHDILANGQAAGCDTGAPLTVAAFDASLPGIGQHIVAIGLTVFGFTTILGWSYYGERCCEYLFGEKSILPFRISWIVVVFLGAAALMFEGEVKNLVNLFWLVADTLTGMMAAPNLVALVVLSPVVFKLTKDYFAAKKKAAEEDSAVPPAE